MYMDDIQLFAKTKKNWKLYKDAVRIYSQNIGMESAIEKCAMLVLKSGQWQLTDWMELPN